MGIKRRQPPVQHGGVLYHHRRNVPMVEAWLHAGRVISLRRLESTAAAKPRDSNTIVGAFTVRSGWECGVGWYVWRPVVCRWRTGGVKAGERQTTKYGLLIAGVRTRCTLCGEA